MTLPGRHPGQREVMEHPARFKVLACGRRWGKTCLGALACIVTALNGGRAWWVAPSYKVALVGWRLITRLAKQVPGCEVRRGDFSVHLPSGGEIWVRSAHDPDSLRGEGLDFVVMDECAFMHESAWQGAIRPALSDRRGRAIFISTPKGRNWFWRLYARGRDDAQSAWHSWSFPTSNNPYIAAEEIAEARQDLPERVFRQEYLAEFLDDAGGVFRRVTEAVTAIPQEGRIDGREYVIGVDWGKYQDFTVFAVMERGRRELVALERFNQIDYSVQVGRLKALAERFQPDAIVVERNAMGEPLVEQLGRDGLPVVPFVMTNATKTQVIDALSLAFERGDIKILPDEVLVTELQAYEMSRSPSGLLRYNAPDGVHDDTVVALALAWHGIMAGAPTPAYSYGYLG